MAIENILYRYIINFNSFNSVLGFNNPVPFNPLKMIFNILFELKNIFILYDLNNIFLVLIFFLLFLKVGFEPF